MSTHLWTVKGGRWRTVRSGFNSSLCVAGSISVSDCLEKRTLEISGEDVQVENKCVCESALTDVT